MRYRLMATYRGVPYEAGIGPSEADVVLFAACPPPEELGFEPATGHWRKQLRIDEVHSSDGTVRFHAVTELDRTEFGVTNKKGMAGRKVAVIIDAAAVPA